ncbi:MAG: hypothetical protein ACRBBP_11375 [Bdellovibrionales bacterium]
MITSSIALGSLQFEPRTINTKSTKIVKPGKGIEKAIKSTHPSFQALKVSEFSNDVQKLFKKSKRALPMSITADFNGDGLQDLAILGKTKKGYKLLAFTSSKNLYTAHEISSWPDKVFKRTFTHKGKIVRYLSLITKKQIEAPANFNKDAFQLETFQGYTELLYFDGKSFKVNTGAIKLKF